MGEKALVHCNTSLNHQVEFAVALKAGLKAHGFEVDVTPLRTGHADLHIVLGPHYAMRENIGKRTILLDRCFFGDPAADVSLTWLGADGQRVFDWQGGRDGHPDLQPQILASRGCRALFLVDYARPCWKDLARAHDLYEVELRRHPAEGQAGALEDALQRNAVAIGYRSTALVAAAFAGLSVVALDDQSPVWPIASHSLADPLVYCDRTKWARALANMNWNKADIINGTALGTLLCH